MSDILKQRLKNYPKNDKGEWLIMTNNFLISGRLIIMVTDNLRQQSL